MVLYFAYNIDVFSLFRKKFMKQKEVTVFVCDHCRKKMFVKSAMERHELRCTKNQLNWDACINCTHCEKTTKTIWFDTYHGEVEKTVVSFKCLALNKTMYPHKAIELEAKYPESFEDDSLMPLPGQCDQHKAGFIF